MLTSERNQFTDADAGIRAGTMGMWLLLLSLTMLFGASLLAFLFVRIGNTSGWPTDLPPLPQVLWVSTALLLISSGTMHIALRGVRRGRAPALTLGIGLTLVLGVGFLIVQGIGWSSWLQILAEQWAVRDDVHRLALTSFYVLTGIHAAHVIGGLIPMAVVTQRAFAGVYTPARHAGVLWCAIYWHFLDVVWLIVFATLLLSG